MKRMCISVLACIALLFALSLPAGAAVYLVCDPQSNVERYEIERNGTVVTTTQAPDPSGTYGFKHDITALADGTYTFRAKACNVWGCSAYSLPFGFVKSVCGAPQTLKLLSE